MDRRFFIVVAVIIALTNAVIYLSGSPARIPGDCSVTIAIPSKGDVVEITEPASGAASLPDGSHLWLLAKPRSDGRWWPQGSASVTGETWKLPVQFGIPTQTGQEFYLAAVAVPEKAHARLIEWAGRRPISFPEIATGCPVDIVVVRRSK